MNETQQAILNVALKVLSQRAILLLGMIFDFTLWCWVMSAPEPLRLISAAAFGVLVLAVHALSLFSG